MLLLSLVNLCFCYFFCFFLFCPCWFSGVVPQFYSFSLSTFDFSSLSRAPSPYICNSLRALAIFWYLCCCYCWCCCWRRHTLHRRWCWWCVLSSVRDVQVDEWEEEEGKSSVHSQTSNQINTYMRTHTPIQRSLRSFGSIACIEVEIFFAHSNTDCPEAVWSSLPLPPPPLLLSSITIQMHFVVFLLCCCCCCVNLYIRFASNSLPYAQSTIIICAWFERKKKTFALFNTGIGIGICYCLHYLETYNLIFIADVFISIDFCSLI